MARRTRGSLIRVAVPIKALTHRFGLFLLLLSAMALMIVSRVDPDTAVDLRNGVVDTTEPILDALSRPVESSNRIVAEIDSMLTLREENAELRLAIDRLKRWELVARRMEAENAALRGLLNLRIESKPSFVTARVIGDSGNAYVRTLLANVGAVDGIVQGQAAITGEGMAGRVVEVGRRASRVLLVTDLNSRIPVVIESTRQRAVLTGDNTDTARLAFLPRDAQVTVGARVITSGHGGVLMPGLPVGVVSSITDGVVRVQPLADLGRIEYVRLVAWEGPRLEVLPEPAIANEAEGAP
ncbi:MAG TPA: rod shape-determining protein MreC [Alphaproteobacteria bacterium]|nr:rod shape-determining protein MreC [Alphaproteobacteria bacterium]